MGSAGGSIRFRGATVVTQDDARRVLQGDVYVEDGRVVAVADAAARVEADRTVEARGQVLVPGLINLHTHLPMTLFRGYGDDMALEPWLHERIWPAEARLDAAAMEAGAALGCLESIANGVTSFLDMYFHEEDWILPAVRRAGLRAWLGEGMVDTGQTPEGEPNRKLKGIEAFVRRMRGDALVTPCPAPHAAYTCHPETFAESARIAAEHGVPLHTHCSETRTEVYDVLARRQARPLAYMDAHGAVGPRTVLAHGGWLTKEEVRRIGAAGAAVAHCPVSNLKLATGGVCPVPELQAEGVRVGLGTDGAASNNSSDLFETMKLAAILQKHHRWDPTALPAQRVLDMATRDAAEALGRPDLGRIVPGATADLALVDFRRPQLAPVHDVVSHLVYATSGRDVSATVVGGRVLMAEGRFETLDAAQVREDAQRAAERVCRPAA